MLRLPLLHGFVQRVDLGERLTKLRFSVSKHLLQVLRTSVAGTQLCPQSSDFSFQGANGLISLSNITS